MRLSDKMLAFQFAPAYTMSVAVKVKFPTKGDEMAKKRFPLQPIYIDEHGIVRFRPNKIVAFLMHWARSRGMDLNKLCDMGTLFDARDWEQFSQLTGYSVSGWGDLSYVSRDSISRADDRAEKLLNKKK